ncbi:histidine phosphatase family protein [Actinospica robiniae]|uniref:histidine phosphatase family protein n=1 Tax=Actinospica robiniae TaxID=304901 RepID=UPI0005529E94|nr:histidine phosphatase family protein [Actinospica robiniae]
MPTTRLLLVRHGDSHHKADGVNGGPRGCRGLTDLGREQAARLRDRLSSDGVALGALDVSDHPVVYSSIIPRAIETAEVVAGVRPISSASGSCAEVITDCGLCTYHMPDWADGMSWDEIRREHGRTDGGVFHPFQEGNESWADLVLRVCKTLTAIATRHVGTTTMVVTHAEAVEASLIAFGSLPLHRDFDIKVTPTSITEWVTQDDPSAPWEPEHHPGLPVRWTLVRLNDAAHLTG